MNEQTFYFDNSATSWPKPAAVIAAVEEALREFGSAGRSFHAWSMRAAREITRTRQSLADLVGLTDPSRIAFTSSATESLNLVLLGLVGPGDHVISSVAEHNSVLRPLRLSGCDVTLLGVDERGVIRLEQLESTLLRDTKLVVMTHGSNVTGNLTETARLRSFCREHGLILVLDVSQTLGHADVTADLADILCFTGHKGLLGPQGTGGMIVNGDFPFAIRKTGGAGEHSFAPLQRTTMPEIFEVGTANAHGLYGLQKGIEHIRTMTIAEIANKEAMLTERCLAGLMRLPGVEVFTDAEATTRLPLLSFRLKDQASADVAAYLWDEWGIACRAGSHCAPRLHEALGTAESGLVRVSFSASNTPAEIDRLLAALDACVGAAQA